jgi:RuvB-like protein 1
MAKARNTAVHSHIKSLGLDENGIPCAIENGVVGQEDAREAAGLIVEMVRSKKMSGRAVLISGPSGCGKTALAVGISEELGPGTPFTAMSGSEVYSTEIKKTEVLQEALRRSILVRIREIKDAYEGEVVELRVIDEESPFKPHSKEIKEIQIMLKAGKGSRKIKVSAALYEQIEKQKIVIGDVVYIEANSGVIKRLGRSELHMSEFDLEADAYIPLPKGEVLRKKEIVQSLTLHDLDVANAKPTGQDVLSLVFQILSPKKSEMTERLRSDVNRIVDGYLKSGNAEIVPGVLFIDEVHMLDVECFTFLHKAIESPLSPTIVFASNKGMAPIRGTSGESGPFGMTKDLLDRVVVINVKENDRGTKEGIIKRRLKEDELELSSDALEMLVDVSEGKSLRYSLSLIPLLKTYRCLVEVGHLNEVMSLFLDC